MAEISLTRHVHVELDWITYHHWSEQTMPQSGTAGSHKFWLVFSGQLEVEVDRRIWKLNAGDAFLTAMHHHRRLVHTLSEAELFALGFNVTIFRHLNLLQRLHEPLQWQPQVADFQRLKDWMTQLHTEFGEIDDELKGGSSEYQSSLTDNAAWIISEGLMRSIFGLCWRQLELENRVTLPTRNIPSWLDSALDYIRSRPDSSVAEWSHQAGFSPAQFRRLFREWTGSTPQQYLQQLRIEEAQRLLTFSTVSVSELAAHLGFGSIPHFTKFFKQSTGHTPTEFRRTSREAPV